MIILSPKSYHEVKLFFIFPFVQSNYLIWSARESLQRPLDLKKMKRFMIHKNADDVNFFASSF